MQIESLLRQLASFLGRRVVDRRSSAHNPHLEVVEVNGRRLLDSASVNYSFGSLHRVFEEAFDRVELERRTVRDALLLGLGAGSVLRLVAERQPSAVRWTAVEIDAVVVDLARRHFALDEHEALRVISDDAAAALRALDPCYDLIVVDVFIDDRIPASIESDEALADLKRVLAPGGLLLFNRLAHTEATRAATAAFRDRFRAIFPDARTLSIRQNEVLVHAAPARAAEHGRASGG